MPGAFTLSAAMAAAFFASATAQAQSIQYRSPAGIEYRAQADTGPIARAQAALAADPRNVERIIQLGVAQSGARGCARRNASAAPAKSPIAKRVTPRW